MMEMIPLDNGTKTMVLSLMNMEHPDAIVLFAKYFGKKPKATSAELIDIDDKGFTLKYSAPGDEGTLKMAYVSSDESPVVVQSIGDCRRALVGMARIAAEATGEKIKLPEPKPGPASSTGGSPAEMIKLLQEMKEMMEKVKLEEQGEGSSSGSTAGIQTLHGAKAPTSTVFKGEGNKLGSSEAKPPSLTPASAVKLREVDPDKSTVSLRVQLVDRKQAQIVVNHDFTVAELRAWLDHHQGPSAPSYQLMDVSAFPPRKLADFGATVESAGLTKAGVTLACRPS